MPLTAVVSAAPDVTLTWRIEAPTADTWQCLTVPDRLATWLGDLVDGVVAADSSFVIDQGEGYCCRSIVTDVRAEELLAHTWEFEDEHPTHVLWALEPRGGGTDLRLSHTGLADLASAYVDGWLTHLTYLEATVLGAPLPTSMFPHLHATFACLGAPPSGSGEPVETSTTIGRSR